MLSQYRRDTLWSSLKNGSAALGNAGITYDELLELLQLVSVQRFENMDSTLEEFMALSQQWGKLHDTVLAKYGARTRHLAVPGTAGTAGGDVVHVVIFAETYMDVAAHLYFDTKTSLLQAAILSRVGTTAASRNAAADGDDDEYEESQQHHERLHLASVVNTICNQIYATL